MPLLERARRVAEVVRPFGWLMLGVAVLAWVAASVLVWRELRIVALTAGVLIVLCMPFLVGRMRVGVDIRLDPSRIAAGGTVSAAVTVSNPESRRARPTSLQLPVGEARHEYGIGSLAAGGEHTEHITIRTERRGVIPVGPATTRRGDPVGLFSREARWTAVHEILVRPPMVALDALGAGLLRDLEGTSTDSITDSDLAFHALREYVPGDDLRHVHWRSSAKFASRTGANSSDLLVRQYLDTRRSHVTVLVSAREEDYAHLDDFESAMSVAASLVARAALDDMETSFLCGSSVAHGDGGPAGGQLTLDAVCRAESQRGGDDLVSVARAATRSAAETSLLFLVTGSAGEPSVAQRAATLFAPEVRRITVRIDPRASASVHEAPAVGSVVTVPGHTDLPGVLRWSLG